MIPVALVSRTGIGLEPRLRGLELLVVVPRRHVEARRGHIDFHDTVAAAGRATLSPADQIDWRRAEARVDRLVVLRGDPRLATVLIIVLDVGDQPSIGEAIVVAILIAQDEQFMRMVQLAGADPVSAVLHPVADVQRGRRREQVPRGAPCDGSCRAEGEVHFGRLRAARDVLGGRRDHAGVIVPAAGRERVILEGLLEENDSPST